MEREGPALELFGRKLTRMHHGGSIAQFDPDVVIESGNVRIRSEDGGKTWTTEVAEGTRLLVHDVPRRLAGEAHAGVDVEVATVSDADRQRCLLESERERIEARLREIRGEIGDRGLTAVQASSAGFAAAPRYVHVEDAAAPVLHAVDRRLFLGGRYHRQPVEDPPGHDGRGGGLGRQPRARLRAAPGARPISRPPSGPTTWKPPCGNTSSASG